MTGTSVEDVNNAWVRLRDALEPDMNRLNWAAFLELSEGHNPTVAQLARRTGLGQEKGQRAAQEALRRGLLTMDGSRITGSRGLSTAPTRYGVRLGGRALFTWCALDAVGIPAALRADAHVEATLLDGTAPVVVDIRRGEIASSTPEDLRIGLPSPTLDRSVRETLCPRIGFHLATQAPQHPDISILTLEQAAELGRRIWSPPDAA